MEALSQSFWWNTDLKGLQLEARSIVLITLVEGVDVWRSLVFDRGNPESSRRRMFAGKICVRPLP